MITFLVPVLIMTYYAVIGGWILKYILMFLSGNVEAAAQDNCFIAFITSHGSVWYALVFMLVTAFIVYNGVEKGIERVSKTMMPLFLIIVVGIAVYSLTLRAPAEDGSIRTGLQGLKVYLTPDWSGMTISRFLQITLDAMSQLFFSLSVSMGIMITYGSYVKPDVDLGKSVSMIELMDTGVALLAGMVIIPAVYVFFGVDGMSAGTGLMFISLPRVFFRMGAAGRIVGLLFFILAAFAALTSCISVLESITANCMEIFHTERKKTTGVLSSILIGWVMKPEWVVEEMERGGRKFGRKKLYVVMIRYLMPVIMLVLFLQSTGILNSFQM